jgi:hypothetical protein
MPAQGGTRPPSWLPVAAFVFTQLVTAGGVYSAIRADLREVQVRVAILERQAERQEARR